MVQAERKDLESSVVELSGKTTALQRWLAENEAKLPEGQRCTSDLACLSSISAMCFTHRKVQSSVVIAVSNECAFPSSRPLLFCAVFKAWKPGSSRPGLGGPTVACGGSSLGPYA